MRNIERVLSNLAKGEIKEVEEKLKKMALNIGRLSTKDKKDVLYNLAYVCYHGDNINSAKFYIKNIRNIIENDSEFMKEFELDYIRVLQLYNILYKEEVSITERLETEKKAISLYFENKDQVGVNMCKFIIAVISDKFRDVEHIYKNIYTLSKQSPDRVERLKYEVALKDMIKVIKNNKDWAEYFNIVINDLEDFKKSI